MATARTEKTPAAKKTTTRRAPARKRAAAKPKVVAPQQSLPVAPKSVLDETGHPNYGSFHGAIPKVDWSGLVATLRKDPVTSFLRHRRWVYAMAATDEILVAVAVMDAGATGTAFTMVTDLKTGEVIADSSRPGATGPLVHVSDEPGEGLLASYRLPATHYEITREPGSKETRFLITLDRTSAALPGLRWLPVVSDLPVIRDLPTARRAPWLQVDLTLESGASPDLSVISPIEAEGGMTHSTVKSAAMNAWGTITIHGEGGPQVLPLDGGIGGMDYSNGFLPRHTRWQWAYGTGRLQDGRVVGFNLTSEFSGIGDKSGENVLWLDGRVIPLDSRARLLFNATDESKEWIVRTVDGSVHLQFKPLATHVESLNLGLIQSNFRQPTGTFSGHIDIDGERVLVDRIPGVAEDQDIRW